MAETPRSEGQVATASTSPGLGKIARPGCRRARSTTASGGPSRLVLRWEGSEQRAIGIDQLHWRRRIGPGDRPASQAVDPPPPHRLASALGESDASHLELPRPQCFCPADGNEALNAFDIQTSIRRTGIDAISAGNRPRPSRLPGNRKIAPQKWPQLLHFAFKGVHRLPDLERLYLQCGKSLLVGSPFVNEHRAEARQSGPTTRCAARWELTAESALSTRERTGEATSSHPMVGATCAGWIACRPDRELLFTSPGHVANSSNFVLQRIRSKEHARHQRGLYEMVAAPLLGVVLDQRFRNAAQGGCPGCPIARRNIRPRDQAPRRAGCGDKARHHPRPLQRPLRRPAGPAMSVAFRRICSFRAATSSSRTMPSDSRP